MTARSTKKRKAADISFEGHESPVLNVQKVDISP